MTKSRGIRPPYQFWTAEQTEQLARLYPDMTTAELARQLGISERRINNKAQELGLKKSAAHLASPAAGRLRRGDNRGKATRFQKGHTTWNKGLTGLQIGGEATQFKPGTLNGRAAQLCQPLGTHRITKDGTLQRKISTAHCNNSQRWRSVHELVWIAAHGPVPAGHIVVFRPGMKTADPAAITLDKVECISFAENMRRNTVHNRYPKEIALVAQLRGAITRQINRRKENKHDQ